MKVRIRNNKNTGETFIEYGAGINMEKYRYTLLKKIIESELKATLVVDSNQKAGKGSLQEAEDFLKQSGIKYSAFPVKRNSMKFFGIDISGKKADQKMIAMEISGDQLSRELYDSFLKGYDIAIGIGGLKTFEETCDMLRIDLREVLFNTAFFRDSIYDSVVCASLRSSFDIKPYIEAAIDETAL